MTIPEVIPLLGLRWDDLLFLALAGGLIGCALFVVLGRDIIRSGLWLILAFAFLAGIYVLLGAPLVAATEVLVYIGAIAVLILFAIMLTQSKTGPAALVFHRQAWAGALAAVVLGFLLVIVIGVTSWPVGSDAPRPTNTLALAQRLFNDWVLPFEIVSVLLLAAVIGGVFLAKKDPAPDDRDAGSPDGGAA
ncbi:MAG TPA: NADH-quinone oxidoreductase subunit J [Candidatus Limnocylindrales bacterium]|nr:NADH-quinone oxidoreductase subunit J [Candidatus Limnocylindrales bacterium]